MPVQITREDLRRIVLAHLDEWVRNLGPEEAQIPRMMIRGRPLSPMDLRREVQMGTDIGIEYMAMEARRLGYVVVG